MHFLFKQLQREKNWVLICLFFMLSGAFFTVLQAVLIANVMSLNLEMVGREALTELTAAADAAETSLSEKLVRAIKLLTAEGNRAAAEYLLSFKDFSLIFLASLLIVPFIILSQLLLFFRDFSSQYLASRLASQIRKQLLASLIYLPSPFFKENKSGDLVARSLSDVTNIENNFYGFLEAAFFGPLMTLTGLGVLLYLNLEFTLIILAIIALLGLLVQFVATFLKRVAQQAQERIADLTQQLQLVFQNIEVIKIFTREEWEKNKFSRSVNAYLGLMKKQVMLTRLNRPLTEIVGTAGLLGIFFYGTNLIWNKQMELSEVFNFIVVLLYIVPYVQKLTSAFFSKQQLQVSSKRLEEIIALAKENEPPPNSLLPLPSQKIILDGSLEFKEVSFSYQQPATKKTALLKCLSFKVKAGEFVAIVGESGSGKTTLLNLIPLLLRPTGGQLCFNGIPHHQLPLKTLRDSIAFVTQESLLFPGTIKENIQYGNLSASFEAVQEAAKKAYLHDFIMGLPKQYESEIGERGVKLSGGQRQRISIARSILKAPQLLLLDEATSALDSHSEKMVQKSITQLISRQTAIVVAHRLSTIRRADKIIVLEKGRLVEMGTHEELLRKKPGQGHYAKLYALQFQP